MRGAPPIDPPVRARRLASWRGAPGRSAATRRRHHKTSVGPPRGRQAFVTRALAAALSLGSGACGGAPSPSPSPAFSPPAEISLDSTPAPPPTVAVRADPGVPSARVQQICAIIRAKLHLPCVPTGARTGADEKTPISTSVDARRSVETLRDVSTRAPGIIMRVTMRPLESRSDGQVFGYASLTDATAIVSLASWSDDAPASDAALSHVILHELGHALGLSHRADRRCVLRADRHRATLTDAPDDYCPPEREELRLAIASARRAGWEATIRVRGHLARRRYAAARVAAITAMKAPMHPTVVAELAAMFSRTTMAEVAVTLWRQTPSYAENSPDLLVSIARSGAPSLQDLHVRCELVELMRRAERRAPNHRGLRRALRQISSRSAADCPRAPDRARLDTSHSATADSRSSPHR